MPTPIISNSPALAALVIKYGENSAFVQRVIQVVNASPAAYDANGDGRIDASDPVYQQLQVWQDLNQDGNNTNVITVGRVQALAQDESGGQRELRSLQEAGITAIDYGNGRYEFNSASSPGGTGYRQAATQTLEAEEEGVPYTAVGTVSDSLSMHYQNNSCVRIFNGCSSTFFLSKTLGSIANPTHYRMAA